MPRSTGGMPDRGSTPPAAGSLVYAWRTINGYHHTAATGTLKVILEAWAGDKNEVDAASCTFTVNDGATDSVFHASAKSLTQSDYASAASPLPGVASDMAPVWGFSATLNFATLASGTITVTAEITSSGVDERKTTVTEVLTIYNDADQTDRRPCTNQIYLSPTGNDTTGNGTQGNPYKTGQKGLTEVRNGTECGGGEIVLMTGAHEWFGGAFGMGDWSCTGAWRLKITFQSGATMRRNMAGVRSTNFPESWMFATGVSGSGNCNIHMVNPVFVGEGAVIDCAAEVTCDVFVDGGESRSQWWAANKKYSVRFWEDYTQPVEFSGTGAANAKVHYACHTRKGCTLGFANFASVQDCVIENCTGIAVQETGFQTGALTNCLLKGHRYKSEDTDGYVDLDTSSANVLFDVSDATGEGHAGKMKIKATTTAFDFGTTLAGLVDTGNGENYWSVQALFFVSGGNNGTFEVLAAGDDGGLPFVVLDNSSFVAGTSLTGRIRTVRASDSVEWTQLVHPDFYMWNRATRGSICSFFRAEDTGDGLQGFFTDGHNLTNCVLVGCSAGGEAIRSLWGGTDMTNCLIAFNSTAGPWDFFSGPAHNGSRFINNVLDRGSAVPANISRHNHFLTGTPVGTFTSRGLWFASPGTDTMTPSAANLNTAGAEIAMPSSWRHVGAVADSRGCPKPTATGSWA